MIKLTLFGLLFCTSAAFGQKTVELKKKFLGSYDGEISSFQLDSGKDLVAVDSAAIKVEITKDSVLMTIGSNHLSGSYEVMFEAKNYFLLDCRMKGLLAGERIVVYKKGKKISRDGLYPQPNAFLYKEKD